MTKTKNRIEAAMPILEEWAAHKAELDKQFDALSGALGLIVEGPLPNAVWSMWDSYTAAVSERIGDDFEWLQWFWLENDMGRRGFEVKSIGGRSMKVKTLRDLARVIYD